MMDSCMYYSNKMIEHIKYQDEYDKMFYYDNADENNVTWCGTVRKSEQQRKPLVDK